MNHDGEKVFAVRENQVDASDPAEVGKTRALVQVPHRFKKPGQGTVGP